MPEIHRLLIATHNPGKLREFADLLAPLGVTVIGAADLGLPEPGETGATFAANAILKARAAAEAAGLPALGDDSGLCVDALNGAPGVMSARWAGPGRDFGSAMARIERELADHPDRNAHFACVLALSQPDGSVAIFEGRVEGRITFPPRGANGFGYDPIFLPEGSSLTFAEMDPRAKHAISHRARALEGLRAGLLADV
ncbi:MAG: RdgB/HAM1 family non-canonical purine NTP pyrophosphatase [Alphaproteobacteria bacterium]|nr:RdgB/HAM1 family non-canonical purine NTP pyrophosphatase [Alphaproteobacteria bacterium]